METYSVRVRNDRLVFSAAHFIALGSGECEPLHGHDYHVTVEVRGPLDEIQCVVDFCLVEKLTVDVISQFDHSMLLPGESPEIQVDAGIKVVKVDHAEQHWQFPAGDCVILPVSNTSNEMLARHIAEELLGRLCETLSHDNWPDSVEVRVAESPGRAAGCRITTD
ncbi:MAG: 6-carboxytetrahydropterin synthase [Planctomycetota bacterium]|nr:6-carboxytetrahydropterin synthase [Planctomycetota bacterium]